MTEVCHAVGFSSLGSFSSRFRALVGESPSDFQRRYAATGAPHIPGCFVFMWASPSVPQSRRSGNPPAIPSVVPMITNISIVSVFVKDIDESKKFYTDVLGFQEKDDITLGDGYRWCTVVHPSQPELNVSLAVPGPPHRPSWSRR